MGAEFAASGVLGPSTFPYTSLGGRVKWIPRNDWLIKAAVLDGVPSDPGNTRGTKIFLREKDGALIAAELSYFPDSGNNLSAKYNHLGRGVENPRSYRIAIGGWAYTKSQAGWPGNSGYDKGIYAIWEGNIYKESGNDSQGLNGFARLGFSNENSNRFTAYSGAGMVYTGPFEGRGHDQLGLAIALPWGSSNYEPILKSQGLQPTAFEMNIEMTYLFVTSSFINIQLDGQYIVNPNTTKNVKNAFVIGTRMQLTF